MFSERLKEARKSKSMSIEKLADLVGLSRQKIYKYESRGVENPSFESVRLIAKTLDVSPSWLVGWENSEETASEDLTIDEIKDKVAEVLLKAITNIEIEKATPEELVALSKVADSITSILGSYYR